MFDAWTYFGGITGFQALGVLGSVLYLVNFFGLQMGLIDGNGHTYRLGSLVAASLVLLSLTEQFNLASAIIQISWIALSLLGFARAIWIVRRMRKAHVQMWQ